MKTIKPFTLNGSKMKISRGKSYPSAPFYCSIQNTKHKVLIKINLVNFLKLLNNFRNERGERIKHIERHHQQWRRQHRPQVDFHCQEVFLIS